MARRLSKKKTSGWLLLIAAIVFFRCDGYEKTSVMLKQMFASNEPETEEPDPMDLIVDEQLVQRLDSFVEKTPRMGSLGVFVWDETAHKPVYSYNPDTLMSPASNMKLLTCITALRRLGPNYRFESGVYAAGEMQGDTLIGDLAFKFTFDPFVNSDSIALLASAVAQQGIRRVKGKIILDLAVTEPMQHEKHWTIGDLKMRKLGLIYRGETRMTKELQYALNVQGVNYTGCEVLTARVPKGARLIKKISTPMRRSVFRALQNSSNEHAECLGFALARAGQTTDEYRKSGTQTLWRFIENEIGILPETVCRLHDTSGLCFYDKLTPRFLVYLLRYAHAHTYIYNELERCLPVSGMTGTLHDRMLRQKIRGKLQAKTGTLTREDGITSLCGFTRGRDGHLLFFSIIQNGYPVYDARRWQDRFCEKMQ